MMTPSKDPIPMDLCPQAVLQLDVEDLIRRYPDHLQDDRDDLDHYRAAFFHLDAIPLALLHYDRHPPGTTTIYLDLSECKNVERITSLVDRIVGELALPPDCILWQRRHGNDCPEWRALSAQMIAGSTGA